VSTEIEDTAATATPSHKFTAVSRMFHWLTAILIFAALLIGFTMVNWLAGYTDLRGECLWRSRCEWTGWRKIVADGVFLVDTDADPAGGAGLVDRGRGGLLQSGRGGRS
jgi:hypothetical protein